MTNLVFTGESNQVLTNSLLVAEKFGKEHKRIMQDIRELGCSDHFREHNFVLSSYVSFQNKELPMYIISRDGFTLLAMGYTGEMAMRFKEDYIAAFNEMESRLKNSFYIPQTKSEALRLAAIEAEKVEALERQIETDKPKVLLASAFEVSKGSCLIGELAKIIAQNGYTIGPNRLFNWLRDNDYLCKSGEARNQPTQRAVEMKLFELKKTIVIQGEESKTYATTKVTPKGQAYFINKFLTSNTLPA